MKTDFLQDALSKLIPNFPDWYGWAKTDSDGNKIKDENGNVMIKEGLKTVAIRNCKETENRAA